MANINLLTPQAIYGKNVHFQSASATTAGVGVKAQIGSLVEAGKTHFVTSLVYSNTIMGITSGAQQIKLYKKLANGSEVLIFSGQNTTNNISNFEIIKKSSGGIYLEENEALIIELIPSYNNSGGGFTVSGYMTYLEIA